MKEAALAIIAGAVLAFVLFAAWNAGVAHLAP
jgi:hypothetical protein